MVGFMYPNLSSMALPNQLGLFLFGVWGHGHTALRATLVDFAEHLGITMVTLWWTNIAMENHRF